MNYIYARDDTRGTTGYYSCLPDPAPDLQAALVLLAQRPLDTFLRRYALKQILNLDQAEFVALIAESPDHPILSYLLNEAAALNQELAPLLTQNQTCEDAVSYNYKPLSFQYGEGEEAQLWRQNIHAHQSVPQLNPREINIAAQDLIAWRVGMLASIWDKMRAQTPEVDVDADNGATYAKAQKILHDSGLSAGPEMRHEASLCPIALLREWHVRSSSAVANQTYKFKGKAIAYGRGLTLAQARVSCAMEIIERASAFADVQADGWINDKRLRCASYRELLGRDEKAIIPASPGIPPELADIPLYWLEAETVHGEVALVPAQAAYLFLNLPEPELFEELGSTGLGAGTTKAQAKLAALLEVIERDSHATMPFLPERCFELESTDPIISGLLNDYRWRGIHVQFQDITTELGVPAYRCFVYGHDGRVAQATGASLSGRKAALAALTETPWPYSWANPIPAPSGRGLSGLSRRKLEDLPEYELPGYATNLHLLEESLLAMDLEPVYVELTRPDLDFPVYRAFIPGLETDAELTAGPSARLLARL